MPYFSETWKIEVRDEIAAEFTASDGSVDDNLAGLHEVRARLTEQGILDPRAQADQDSETREALKKDGWKVLPTREGKSAA